MLEFEFFFVLLAMVATAATLSGIWRYRPAATHEAEPRIARIVDKVADTLDRLAARPGVMRVANSKAYRTWGAPALQALFLVLNGLIILAAFLGCTHWLAGAFSFLCLLLQLAIWRVIRCMTLDLPSDPDQ